MQSHNGRVRIGVGRYGAALGAALVFFATSRAHASCRAPEPEILWSWPADGAVDVPIDADLLLAKRGFYSAPLLVTLRTGEGNGVDVTSGSTLPDHFDLGTLAPHTRYTIKMVVANTPFADAISFETGEGRSSSQSGGLRVASVSEDPWSESLFDSENCDSIIFADSCYDTGVPPIQAFDIDGGAPPIDPGSLWVIETIFEGESYFRNLPAVCGKPMQFGSSRTGVDSRVYNVGTNGAIRESELLVGPLVPPLPPRPEVVLRPANTDASGVSCNLTPSADAKGPGAMLIVSGLFAAVLRRRAYCKRP